MYTHLKRKKVNAHVTREKKGLLSIVEKCSICIDLRGVQSIFSIRKEQQLFVASLNSCS